MLYYLLMDKEHFLHIYIYLAFGPWICLFWMIYIMHIFTCYNMYILIVKIGQLSYDVLFSMLKCQFVVCKKRTLLK